MMSRPGIFITFEGGEGAGKTTQISRLANALRAHGRDVIETREPGGTPAADALWNDFIRLKGQRWPVVAQAMFMFTLRALHAESVIRPALAAGKVVISDRFTDSTRVYQGHAAGYAPQDIETLKRLSIGNLEPDLTLILDIAPLEGLRRAGKRDDGADTFEEKDIAFHNRLREGYLAIASENPDRCAVIDASNSVEEVAALIESAVFKRFPDV